jgi:hypothetical protein
MRIESMILCAALSMLLSTTQGQADELRFDSPADWDQWNLPVGLINIGVDGSLTPRRFRKDINAVADAGQFSHPTLKRGEAAVGGVWAAGSNPDEAANAIDGDPGSVWRPAADDAVEDWFLDIDLGRVVLAREIRLVFPDTEGARPFRQFTVFVSTGARIDAQDDVFQFEPIFRTTQPNTATEVVIPLQFFDTDSTFVLDPALSVDRQRERFYRAVQYISIEVDERSSAAALAEVEVIAVGDNVSLGTQQRGNFTNGLIYRDPQLLFDGDMNTFSLLLTNIGSQGGWLESGVWWHVDLGATYFLDEIFTYAQARGEALTSFLSTRDHGGDGHIILTSAGEPSISTSLPVPEPFDYTELLAHDQPNADGLFHVRYLFPQRKVRYLFWRGIRDQGWSTRSVEMMLFSQGHPAEVVLRSGFLNLGELAGDGSPKVISGLEWEAGTPPATRVQLRSRTGNLLNEEYTFHDRAGNEVSESRWNSSPVVLRGKVDTTVIVGDDWGPWSSLYQESGEPFQSDSPRRFLQLELVLATEDPQVAPVLENLRVSYEEALVQGARGQIEPRSVAPNEDTRFSYRLWPRVEAGDRGFDRLRFLASNRLRDIAVSIDGQVVQPAQVETRGDSVEILLDQRVLDDSVEVRFTTRILQNATVFPLELGDSNTPGLWQSVEPAQRRSDVVLVPALAGTQRLIGDLRLTPSIFSPNGDGANDQVQINFVVFKIEEQVPAVRLYDLSGVQKAVFSGVAGGGDQQVVWDGRDSNGKLVPPGIYLCQIDLGAAAGRDTAWRSVVVAY